MATAPAPTFDSIAKALRRGESCPVMVFHGEEGYFIDELTRLVGELIPEADRDFALTTVYAPQAEAQAVADMCRSLPMMTERQVVIVKEAQGVPEAWLNRLAAYAASPTATTVLAVCGRGKKVKGAEFIKAVKAGGGLIFEAEKVKDWLVERHIGAHIKELGLSADDKALSMLHEFIGADLSRLYNEVDKLVQILGPNARITPEAVERNVGVSKEYNAFELVDALAAKDAAKAMRISRYFAANPKAAPLVMVIPAIFNFFSDLLAAYYTRDKSDGSLKAALGLRNDFALRRLRGAMRLYNAYQVIEVLHALRMFDAMSKGAGSRRDPYELFDELVFHILSAPGTLPV